MEICGVHHLAIKAEDVERTARFYTEVLGLTAQRRNEDQQGLRSIWVTCGGTILMIERATGGRTPPAFHSDPPALHLLALTIPAAARAAWRERLEDAGHRIVHETEFTLYTQDPEGNRVGLCHL